MEVSITAQALSLGSFLALGLCLGLLYDFLRPARYSGAALAWDTVFCALAAGAVFWLGMVSGRIGIWDIMAILLSFSLYINFFSRFILPPLLKLHTTLFSICSFFRFKTKIFAAYTKKFFTNSSD